MRRDARVNGVRLVWDEVGERGRGPALLLVHGFPLNRSMWAPQVAALAGEAYLVVPDLRGHGESEAPSGPYRMADFAADLAALLDYLELPRVVFCGLSMGGYIGFAFVRDCPDRLQGLILADTRAGADTAEQRAAREELATAVERAGSAVAVERLRPRLVAPATRAQRPDLMARLGAMIAGTPPAGLAGTARGLAQRPDSTALLSQITVPTLILVGAEDEITPPADAERLHAGIAGSTLRVLAGGGHMANLEHPEAFTAALRAFLQRL